jgi:hypothetical protein
VRAVLGILLLATLAPAETLVVSVRLKNKPVTGAFVTWDRPYGGGHREIAFVDENGRAELELAPGSLRIYACHEQYGIVEADHDLKANAELTLDLLDARPAKAALTILDDKSGEPLVGASFTLLRAGDGRERNRPREQKFHPTDRVLGLCVVPEDKYDDLPPLYLRSPYESDEKGRIVVGGLRSGPVAGIVTADGYAPVLVEGKRTVRLRRGANLAIRVPPLPRLREGPLFWRLVREGGGTAVIGATLPQSRVLEALHLPAGRFRLTLTSIYPGPTGEHPGAHGVAYRFDGIELEHDERKRLKLNWAAGRDVEATLPDERVHQVVLRSDDFRFSIADREAVRTARFPGVPAGRYQLEFWADRGLAYRRPVDVRSGEGALTVGAAPAVAAVHGASGVEGAVAFCGDARDFAWADGKYRLVLPHEGEATVWMQTGLMFRKRTLEVRGETRLDWDKQESGLACTVELIGPDGLPLTGYVEIEGPFPRPTEPRARWDFRLPAGKYRFRAHARRCKPSRIEVDLRKPQEVSIRLAPAR